MMKSFKKPYVSPVIELIVVEVEQGFAGSGGEESQIVNIVDWDNEDF